MSNCAGAVEVSPGQSEAAAITLYGLARQAQHAAVSASQILGIGIKGEVALDHLRLVPLGAQCWADDSMHGARLVWTDPDALAVTVLERSWPLAATALHERRLVGQPLHKLARSQVVTRAAKRQANGALSIGDGATQTSVLPLSASGWDTLARPLRQPTRRRCANTWPAWRRTLCAHPRPSSMSTCRRCARQVSAAGMAPARP